MEQGKKAEQAKIWMEKSIEAIKIGENEKGLEYAKCAVEIDSENAVLWSWYGGIFHILNRYDESLQCYDRALKIDPRDGRTFLLKGRILYTLHHFGKAIECFDEAIKFLPENTEPLCYKGWALEELGEFQKAIEFFDKVLSINDSHHDALGEKAHALAELDMHESALQCYEKFTHLYPENDIAWHNKGLSEEKLGYNSEALISYNCAISRNPKNNLALCRKGFLLINDGNYTEALKYFELAIKYGNIKAANGIFICKVKMASKENFNIQHDKNEFEIGDLIEHCFLVHGIKRGNMGIVYLCYDEISKRPVAIKTFHNEFLDDVICRQRFLKEGQIWIRLLKHQNIVECYSTFEIAQGRPYLVLEYVDGVEDIGPSLRDWIDNKRLDSITSINFAIQICTALQYAQNVLHGFVHCDLKPSNILINKDKIVKVTDFGISKVFEKNVNENYGSGSYPYMSPEQVKAETLNQQSDIYSFGCILYEMLSNNWIFEGKNEEEFKRCHLEEKPTSPSSLISLPPELSELDILVMQCLEKELDKRPKTFGEISEKLKRIYEQFTGQKMQNTNVTPLDDFELINKAITMMKVGMTEKGLDFLSIITQESFSQIKNLVNGQMLYQLGQYQEALEMFELFLNLDPEHPNARFCWESRGRCLTYLGRHADALNSYDKAIEINEKPYEVYISKAVTLRQMGRFEEAQKNINDYLKIDSQHCYALYIKARILYDQQKYLETIEYCDRVLKIDPICYHAENLKGCAFMFMQKWEQAISCFDRVIEIDKLNIDARYNRGSIMVKLGKLEDAINSLDQVLDLNPEYLATKELKNEIKKRLI